MKQHCIVLFFDVMVFPQGLSILSVRRMLYVLICFLLLGQNNMIKSSTVMEGFIKFKSLDYGPSWKKVRAETAAKTLEEKWETEPMKDLCLLACSESLFIYPRNTFLWYMDNPIGARISPSTSLLSKVFLDLYMGLSDYSI